MRTNQEGFTLIELFIGLAMVCLVVLVALSVRTGGSNLSFGFNGITEERCIAGYKHIIGENGQARQIFNQLGQGIPCP